MLLTGEGGRLKRNVPLVQGRDFVLVPDSLWKALQQWYGGSPALPRQVMICWFIFFSCKKRLFYWLFYSKICQMSDLRHTKNKKTLCEVTRKVVRATTCESVLFSLVCISQVIHGRSSGEVELELYPVTLRLFRHVQQQTRTPNNSWVGVVGGYGAAALSE